MIHRIDIFTTSNNRVYETWVNPVAKSMLPNLWQVVPRWIRYCFSMLPILLHCSSETVRIGWVAIRSTDNCCLINAVYAVLVDSEHAAHWHFLKQLLQHEWTSVLPFVSHDPRYVILDVYFRPNINSSFHLSYLACWQRCPGHSSIKKPWLIFRLYLLGQFLGNMIPMFLVHQCE